jgi:GMP synthase (glutamine-hydrolysing)
MRLLVVEGNKKETRILRESFGIKPYHLIFKEMLHFLEPTAHVDVVFPAHRVNHLPTKLELKKYGGVLWTGSSLSVLDNIPSVNRQLSFAEEVFDSGVPFYGSCWGLQIATVVAGGAVGKNVNGLELGVSKPIELTRAGKESPFFSKRKNNFNALCIHYEEIVKTPENSVILAKNSHSKVQAMTIKYKNSDFFGVQYHPEFRNSDMALISSFLAKKQIETGFHSSKEEAEEFVSNLSDRSNLPEEIVDFKLHSQEIGSWLNHIKTP